MANPKEGYNSGVNRNVTGSINDDGDFTEGSSSTVPAGTWYAETYQGAAPLAEVSNSVVSKEIPAGAIALKARYKDVSSATGVSVGIAIGAVDQSTGDALIDADTVTRLWLGDSLEMIFAEDTSITRLDFKSAIAETGDSALVIEWQIAS